MQRAQKTILIVEDEEAIREMLAYTLMKAGYACIEAGDVEQARPQVRRQQPDLILLDWMLPGISGIDYLRQLRSASETRHIPIIMLTAKGAEDDRVRGLETGTDDYLTKPFSNRELLARVQALLRRAGTRAKPGLISANGLTLNPDSYRVTTGNETIEFSPMEFKLLHFFIAHPEKVYSRMQLLNQVWGEHVYVEERTVDVHIRRLRKTLAPYGYDGYIQTVRSVGYRFSTG